MRAHTDIYPPQLTQDAPSGPNARLSPGMVEVNVDKAADVDDALREAVDFVYSAATEHRMGIMVTRIGAGWYIVRAHPEVPLGLVRQRHG